MIEPRTFEDYEDTQFTTRETWGMDMGGVAQIQIRKPKFSFNRDNDIWGLWLDPELARKVAKELNDIADSVERQQLKFERERKQSTIVLETKNGF